MTRPVDADTLPDGQRIPTLFGVASATRLTLRVYCIFCGRWHTHGCLPEFGAANGHVVAHCIADDSPYRDTGYYIEEVEALPEPTRPYKVRYAKDGTIVSGFLYARRRAGDNAAEPAGPEARKRSRKVSTP